MKKLLFFVALLLPILFFPIDDKPCCSKPAKIARGGRCTGSANCTACKNCSRCAYCNSGGSCGVCSRGSSSKKSSKTSYSSSTKSSNSTYNSTISDDSDTYVVNSETLNVRKLPSISAEILCSIKYGQTVEIINQYDDKWAYVEVYCSGSKINGYVYLSYLRKD